MMAEVIHCERCGASRISTEACWFCPVLDRRTALWSTEAREKHFADTREMRREAEAAFAAMSEEEIATLDDKLHRGESLNPTVDSMPTYPEHLLGKPWEETTEAEKVEKNRIFEERMYALPASVPPLRESRLIRGCTELTGDEEGPSRGIALGFDAKGWWLFTDQSDHHPWRTVVQIAVDGPETVERRTTVPRALALGLFSLGFKKAKKRSYLSIQTESGTRLFEVPGLTPWELRGHLMPILDWLGQYGPQIAASKPWA
jgi:uncharacterized Zn finger protein (UPF0148 family)